MRSRAFALAAIITMLATLIPMAVLIVPGEVDAQDPGQPLMLNQMRIFLSEGMGMTPLPPESADEYQAISIPNGFI